MVKFVELNEDQPLAIKISNYDSKNTKQILLIEHENESNSYNLFGLTESEL